MAVPSNSRSPSPLSSRPTASHSRNSSDSNAAARRSFSGNHVARPSVLTNPRSLNPVTPANSPAGFGRRNSFGCDEKENEKDQNLKPVKVVKSPANGSKNFMSPTISAASKITPSPRKKILVERNDPLRTSISLSEGKAIFFSGNSSENKEDLAVDHQNGEGKRVVVEGPQSSKASKRVTFLEVHSDSETATEVKPETVTVNSSSKNMPSCFPISPIIAPLDADPSLPPYDPKTNYLSPRPQFLHYKPNPRIEVLLNKEKGLDLGEAKRLDDSFLLEASESYSDNDGTEGSCSEESQKHSEDYSVENVVPEAEEEGVHVYEVSTIGDPISEDSFMGIIEEKEEPKTSNGPICQDMCEGIAEGVAEAKTFSPPDSCHMSDGIVDDTGKARPWFFSRLKSVSLLLVLLMIACLSIWGTDSPFMDSSSISNILKFSKLTEPSQLAVSAKANLNGLGVRFKQLSLDSISHLSLLINNIGGVDNIGTVKFMNLTDLQSDMLVSSFRGDYEQRQTFLTDLERENLEEGEGSETEPFDEQTFADVFSDDFFEKDSEEESEMEIEESPPAPVQLAEMNELEKSETLWNHEAVSSNVDTELKYKLDYEGNSTPVLETPGAKSESEAFRNNPEAIESLNTEVDMPHDSGAKVESSSADSDHESTSDALSAIVEDRSSEMAKFPIRGSENKYRVYSVMAMASLVLALVSAAASVYLKQCNASDPNLLVHTDGLSSEKISPVSSVPQKMFQENASCHNWATEVDVEGEESFPSEMSSSKRSSSYSRKDLRGANEVHSHERKPRKYSKRESLASSSEFSEGSPSYGSFTTYERISNKHANGDDEIMTPVRRSSRLRYQVNFS
ncbi:uncharacterized protein [Coffea arabica]|uniref:Uncharacterized protein n=1 Tax=Coffea arabica TaxID=13443 RepID=A0A6P6WBS3_COFAR|nr:uncharacterized protein LOC113731557 [Coffea arabica]